MESHVAIVTGGASGIGNRIAQRLGKRGMRIVITYYADDPHDPNAALDLIRPQGGDCIAVAADVSDPGQCEAVVAKTMAEYGRLDSVVAAAGVIHRADFAEGPLAAWDRSVAVDLSGVAYTFRAAIPHLESGASMVAFSSIAGAEYGWSERAGYSAAKAGVLGLVRTLALELGPKGVTVNAVVPGLIRSPQTLDGDNSLGEGGLEVAKKAIPLGRVGDPDYVAGVVEFLLGHDARYITGTEILIDGGLRCTPPGA